MHHVDLVLKKLCSGIHIRSGEYRNQTVANEVSMIQNKFGLSRNSNTNLTSWYQLDQQLALIPL